MSRRGDYEEYDYEQRAYYPPERDRPRQRPAPVRGRDLVDLYASRLEERAREPEYVQTEYKVEGAPLVLRERRVETFTRPARRSPPRERSPSIERERVTSRTVERERERSPSPAVVERTRTRVVERERERSPSPQVVERVRTRTKTVERERERSPSPKVVERTRTRVVERERDRSPSPQVVERTRTRVVERERDSDRSPGSDRIRMRYVQRDRDVSPARSDVRVRTREFERDRTRSPSPHSRERVRTTEKVVERERDRSPSPRGGDRIRTTDRFVERERNRSPSPRGVDRVRTTDRVVERERNRSPSPRGLDRVRTTERVVERERDRSPSPLGERERIRTRTVAREREIARSPSLDSSGSMRGDPRIRAPSIHREIVTHHRHIDHGIEYAPSPPPLRRAERDTEVDIYAGKGGAEIDIRKSTKVTDRERPRDRDFYDDGVLYEREHERERRRGPPPERRRSISGGRERDLMSSNGSEIEYYSRRTEERAYIDEPRNGAPRQWDIVDAAPPTKSKDEMWTEITKDLVVREALQERGYEFEETEFFYYVMRYLTYEDVQELVLISKDIKKDRKRRIKEIAKERALLSKEPVLLALPAPPERRRNSSARYDDERIIEREIVFDGPSRR